MTFDEMRAVGIRWLGPHGDFSLRRQDNEVLVLLDLPRERRIYFASPEHASSLMTSLDRQKVLDEMRKPPPSAQGNQPGDFWTAIVFANGDHAYFPLRTNANAPPVPLN